MRSSRRRTYPVESLVPIRDGETITVKLDRERGVFRRVDHLDWISTAVAAALAPARRRMQCHD